MSDQKATVLLAGSVALILVAALGFGFAQDGGNPVLGAAIGALVAVALCAVAFLRPQLRDESSATEAETSTATQDLRQRRNAAAWRFIVTLGAIVALWLIVFFIL